MAAILNPDSIPHADPGDPAAVLEELRKTRALCKKLNDIIEYAPDGIYVTDGDANAIRINPAFSRISGLKREEMLGRNHRELEEEGVVYQSSALKVVRSKKPVTIIHEYLPTKKQALVTSIPVFDGNGEIEMIVSSTRDLTELNDLKNELAIEREQRIKAESRMKLIREKMMSGIQIIAVDKKTIDMLYMAAKISSVDSTVLIYGETGVGKEEIAKHIHNSSPRSQQSFVAINCGAIPETLVESELFGYEKGAFTGAQSSGKPGLLELANQGTLFLDEIGELPSDMQVKLLRAIETRRITRIGGRSPISLDVRIIAATNRDLSKMVEEGLFRSDLYYRLNVVPMVIPPLRERRDDIIPLVNHFLAAFNRKYHLDKSFSNAAYNVLYDYNWPGNVRELKNVVERTVVTSDGDLIQETDLPIYRSEEYLYTGSMEKVPLKERIERIEYAYIKAAYEREGSIRTAAQSLGMPPSTYIRKMKEYQAKYSVPFSAHSSQK